MRRAFLNAVTALSLAVFVAAGALCLYTLKHYESAQSTICGTFVRMTSSAGLAGVQWQRDWPAEIPWSRDSRTGLTDWPGDFPEEIRIIGLRIGRWPTYEMNGQLSTVHHQLIVPYWMLLVTAIALPAYRLAHWFARSRLVGMCPVCGYDLRATPDRCPECGHVPARGAKRIHTDPPEL